MKPEARLWQVVKAKMWMPGDRLDRVENSMTTGQPDVNGCMDAEDVWVELKAPKEPKRSNTVLMTSNGNHQLLQSQMNWMRRQRQAGGIAFILVRTDQRVMLIEGTEHMDAFNKWTLSEMISNSLYHHPTPMPEREWKVVRYVLITATRNRRLHRQQQAQQLLNRMERKGVASHRGS